jgi:molybdate transport system substrate-binding protein
MWRTVPVLAAVSALALAGCGGSGDDTLTVSAAASLKKALTQYGGEFEDAKTRFSFAGSDELAAQIRKGAKPDVFASANTKLPDQLSDEGLVERPVTFAGNRLVLAVPASSDAGIASLRDIEKAGTTLAIGSESVPVGSYTRTVLAKLPESESSKILENVRTQEPDVAGITGKLTQGAVDAGFLYVSDVRATDGALKAIELPRELQPEVAYGVAVVTGAKHPEEAKAFIAGLLRGAGAQALEDAGFEPPPGN